MKKNRRFLALERELEHAKALTILFNIKTKENEREELFELMRKLRRLENKMHRLNEQDCDGEPQEKMCEQEQQRVIKSLAKLIGENNIDKIKFNGDPRGYALKIKDNILLPAGIMTDLGRNGILAPNFK